MSPAASRLFIALALVGCLPSATSQAFAQDADPQVVGTISGQELQQILQAEGYLNVDVDADGNLNFKIEGTKVQIFVAENQQSIQFHSAWAGTNATLRSVNEWNKTKKYSK
ncbi:MAG: YbjN domain-containing protein, partial [Maioricimonas sp. JB049]